MGDAGTSVRIVPSGKIYRQMFEAQVQLNQSLTKIARDNVPKPGRSGTDVPIVQMSKDDLDHGILGSRQRTWADGFPNDPYVENPVVYKQYAEYVSTQMKEPESSVAGKEVRGLPDVIAPAKEPSNIIERIAASRKERHEAAVEEMHQELAVINADLEPMIEESSQQLLDRLEEDDQEIALQLAKFHQDDDLLSFTLEGLHQLWDEIQTHSQHRQDWITQLDDTLKKAEDDRMEMIHTVFKDYAKMLEKIAYVLLPDMQRFLNKESQLINQTVLSNRRAYGDLYVRLLSSDIEREKNQHIQWKRRVDDWKTLNTEKAIQRFSTYMQHEKVVNPPGVQKVMQYMITEQEMLNSKRLELIDHLQDLKPPSSTKTSVYHWNKGVQDVSQEIDTSSQLHLTSLHKEYENVCQTALDEIEAIKMDLVDQGVCTGDKAQTVVEQFMIPIVGDRQRIYEENLETMEKNLEDHNKAVTEELKSLFKYAQGAAHVWDVHEIGLARQERALQEKLEQCRQQHDNQNQDKEAHLDIIMDRMRQDATEKALKDSLSKALDMLEKIRLAYEVFHTDQTGIVKGYPNMVRGELGNFDEAVCRFFSVSRRHPQEDEVASDDDAEAGTGEEDGSRDGQLFQHPSLASHHKDKFKISPSIKGNEREQRVVTIKGRRKKFSMKPAAIDVNFIVGLSASSRRKKKGNKTSDSLAKDAEDTKPVINHRTKAVNSHTLQVNETDQLDSVNGTTYARTEANTGHKLEVATKEASPLEAIKDIEQEGCYEEKIPPNGTLSSRENSAPENNSYDEVSSTSGKENNSVQKANSDAFILDEILGNEESTSLQNKVTLEIQSKTEKRAFSDLNSSPEERENIEVSSMQTSSGELSCETGHSIEDNLIESTDFDKLAPPAIFVTMVNNHRTEGSKDIIANARDGRHGKDDRAYGSSSSLSLTPPCVPASSGESGLDLVTGQKQSLHLERMVDLVNHLNEDSVIGEDKEIIGGGPLLNGSIGIDIDEETVMNNDLEPEKKKAPPAKKFFKFMTAGKEEDIKGAVREVLNTAKGTTFYVLTVAGEHGVPAEKTRTDTKVTDNAFMTEVSQSPDAVKPEYVSSIDVPKSVLDNVKQIIRMNFLNHLEEWTDQASERAQSVVVAKCEEMNSELDLRLHLHKPRARRAEYDVHNVRAAELVMHSERVTRHCKGIQQALTEVRNRFSAMQADHNNLTTKFREDIEALEVVFINATKASRLYGLKNQLNVELDQFMSVIRASLRQYRQHLDETLQMLRESNARFIKSFKVFSDGGNFCPEEIDEYRKRLDKMSTKIDSSEGSIMADLEGMESKRLEQATKVAMEFEDRFKSHMIDLIFMEKIARWLTNTQVKIKAEVARSNTQAQQLGQHVVDLERRIDACERPNLDKEQITSQQLNDSLKAIFEAFHSRSVYLNSLKDEIVRPTSGVMQGAPGVGARVGFVQDTGPTPISKAGKQPNEDPSVGVIKHIMKTQKSKLRFGTDAEMDGELVHTGGTGDREKMKSSMSTNASSDRGKQSRRGVSPGPASTEGNRKNTSGAMRKSSKPTKYEKKILIFGDNIQEDDETADTHFLGIIRKSLKDALDGLLSSSELYYRQKGSRTVTRPQALQETFDQCADVIVLKLQSYYHQADEYHNQCLQEFRSQLSELERSVAHVPALVISDLVQDHVQEARRARTDFDAQFAHSQSDLQNKQKEHQHLLRPTLGHPHQVNELSVLVQREMDRHTDYTATVEQHTTTLQESTVEHGSRFLESLASLAENQLLQYDYLLVVDDVDKGRVEPKKYPTSELIRRKNAGEALEDDEDRDALPRGIATWTGIANNELVVGDEGNKEQLTASVTTAKTTLGHSAVVNARDQAYQDYKKQFEKTLQMIDDEKQRFTVAEQRWLDSWNTSVEKVKMLY